MGVYNVGDLKKGLKVEVDREPYLIVECQFVKPGKGQAMYKLRLKNLLRQTILERTYRSGDVIDAADVREADAQFLYKQGDTWHYMDNESYEQGEITVDQIGDEAKWLKDAMVCRVMYWNGQPIQVTPPNHVVYRVVQCEPAARGNTATGLTKPVTLETGAVIVVPAFVEEGSLLKIDTRTGEYLSRATEA